MWYYQPIIAPALAAQQITLLQGFMNSTCVKFVPRTNETDYITIRFWARLVIQLVYFILQLKNKNMFYKHNMFENIPHIDMQLLLVYWS